jgi:diguanylate cyclase (GGDEF)-like protein
MATPSLALRIQFQLGPLLIVAILAMTVAAYFNMMNDTESRTLAYLKDTLTNRALFDSVSFKQAQSNTQQLRAEYLRRLQSASEQDSAMQFQHWFERYPDGLIRVRKSLDDYQHLPSLYIRPNVKITPELQKQVWVGFQLLSQWGPALTRDYYSAYIDLPGIGLIMYSPSVNWGALADPTTNNFDYPPVRNSAPDRNPLRKTSWSEVYYDDKARIWMVSAITPVDQDGKWIASISQDVSVDTLIARTNDIAIPHAYNLIIDTQGRLITHPYMMDKIHASGGNLLLKNVADPALQEIARLLQHAGAQTELHQSADGQEIYGFTRIQGPDWHFVTVYPYADIRKAAFDNARTILIIGLIVLIVGLLVLFFVIHSQIARPLRALSAAMQKMEDGQYDVLVKRFGRGELRHLAMGFNRMVNKIAERDQALIQQARLDVLTGLSNRYHLTQQLPISMALCNKNAQKLAIMFIDLDRFKTVNDSLGHNIGDELLREVAARIVSNLRDGDWVVRLGGDEFIVVVHDAIDTRQAAVNLAQRLITRLEEPIRIDGYSLHTSPSIGISIFPDDGEDVDTLIRKADIAMYIVKEEGRNGYAFYEETFAKSSDNIHFASALHDAFENNEFVLYYQPKVNLKTRQVIGSEALIRWQRPGYGMVMPDQFLGALEDLGLFPQLNKWVLKAALRQLAIWQDTVTQPLPVAINLTPDFYRQATLVSDILQLCETAGVAPELIELEVTEGALLEGNPLVKQNIHNLRAAGIKLAIDDFGTGYSALSYLHQFSFDYLKIDRSFVMGLGGRKSDSPMTRAIILIGESIGLGVIAEGVETETQAAVLQDQGCGMAQGYLFGRPESADDFTHHWLVSKS